MDEQEGYVDGVKRGELIYEGKAKKLYLTDDPTMLIQYFKDDATAFNAKKRGTIPDKGVINNRISEVFFRLLEDQGIPTHFIRRLTRRDMLVRRLDIIPVETVVRNVIAGSLAKRFGRDEGEPLKEPIIEFYLKSDPLDDPMINQWHILGFGFATRAELDCIIDYAWRTNLILKQFLDERGILLVDLKLEFGRHDGKVILGDEICPDTCRFWDAGTMKKLDKDRFRRDLGQVEEAYREIEKRVCG